MTKKVNQIVFCILILYLIYCSLNIGIHWDELNIMQFGEDRLKYLFSLGSNTDYLNQWNSRFYPGAYSTIAMFITKMFPIRYEIEILHIVNMSFGVSALFGLSKIAKELFNDKVSKITFLICFLNPHFFNHMIMNERDLIVAFCNIWATYLILRYLKNQNIYQKRNKYIIFAGLTVGLGLGVRVVFLGTLLPIVFLSLIDILFLKKIINKNFSLKKFLFDCLKIIIIAYFFMIAFWPHTHENIFILPFKFVFESFSTSQIGAPLGLLNGEFYFTKQTPKSYIFVNLINKLPEFILFAYIIFIFILFNRKNFFATKFKSFYYKIFIITLIIIFPNLVLFINPYSIYDGIRHFLYIIPYISIIPALIIYYLYSSLNNQLNKILLISILSMFLFFLFNFLSLTPYHYTYLNTFSGKFINADKKFENDYWGISLRELINQIPNDEEFLYEKKIKLASCGISEGTLKYYLKKLKNIRFTLVNPYDQYDYIIMTNRVVWNEEGVKNPKKAKTCYDTYKGKNILTVSRKKLTLSTIRKSND